MIRLKHLVETAESSKKKLLRVLYVSDHGQDKKIGFMKRLLQQHKVTGLIRTAHERSSTELLTVFEHYISANWDLAIVSCRGIYEPNKYHDSFNIIQNFRIMRDAAHKWNVPVLFVNMPTARFIDDDQTADLTKGDDTRIDDWIDNNADYVLSTNTFLERQFFDKTGKRFSRLAESILYKEMLEIIHSIELSREESEKESDDDTDQIEDNPILIKGIRGNKIQKIQKKLLELGYEIDSFELQQSEVGKTTLAAFLEFKSDNDLDDTNILDKKTLQLLQTSIPTKTKPKSEFPSSVSFPDNADINFYKEILRGINAPITSNTLTFLFAWRDFEAGTAAFNPFNTTHPFNGSTNYNILSFGGGVQNYQSENDGIHATIKTLKNGYYNNLLQSLRNDDSPETIASNSEDLEKWGSGDGPLRVLRSKHVNPEPIYRVFNDAPVVEESRQRHRRILEWIKENK